MERLNELLKKYITGWNTWLDEDDEDTSRNIQEINTETRKSLEDDYSMDYLELELLKSLGRYLTIKGKTPEQVIEEWYRLIDPIYVNWLNKRAKGLTSGDVEGTTRDWEDTFRNGAVYRVETTRDGEWFDEEEVTEEYASDSV